MRLVIALACLLACGRSSEPAQSGSAAAGEPGAESAADRAIDLALRRGGQFLVSRQRADGAIPSRSYAALKDGWSLTPLAALALRFVPRDEAAAAAYRRAVDYIAGIAAPALREAPEVSYPLYAYAIGALVLGAPDNHRHRAAHAQLLAGLRRLQLAEGTGWSRSDVSFGGWGYAARPPLRTDGALNERSEAGGGGPTSSARGAPVLPRGIDEAMAANLSATLLAAGALVLGGAPLDDPALVAARGFVERCQNVATDGGFFFSPGAPDANKAGAAADGGFRSYGSMSADGLRALIRLGAPLDAPRVTAAAAYLARHFDAARNPGDFPPVAEVRRESAYYYWAWSAAHAARHLGKRAWAEALVAELLRRQGADGSWRNPASEMREDDPIIATSFAMAALAVSRSLLAPAVRERSHWY